MSGNKPTLEKILPEFGSSLYVKQNNNNPKNDIPFWHIHPELELVYVNKAKGKRHIGNHLSYFNNSQLILIGANLPHTGFADGFATNGLETVIQFKDDFLGDKFFEIPEMLLIKKLFIRAKMGVLFGIKTKELIGFKIENLIEKEGIDRITGLLDILKELSFSEDYTLLNVDGYALEVKRQDNERIDVIFRHVRENFKHPITLEEVSNMVSMTVPAFCRYYKKITGKTFTQFVNEFRIVHATKLLSETPSSITDVCFESGFNNFSYFSKLFKKITGKSPLKYRNEVKQLIVQK